MQLSHALKTLSLVTLIATGLALPQIGFAATESELLAKLQSGARKEKSDACRELAYLGTKAAVPALVALLPDAEMNHMARVALEAIPDPAVDAAFRDALNQLKGRQLVGVIGSIGVRRDAAAIPALANFLKDADADVAQGAARALGKIGTLAAAQAIEAALPGTAAANQIAFCDGLFRAAENLDAAPAAKIYARLRSLPQAPHQIRAAALRGLILTSAEQAAIALVLEGVQSDDYTQTAAAARAALEVKAAGLSKALGDALPKLPAEKQVLIIQVLGKRGDAAAYPALFAMAKSGAANNRSEAIKALPQIGKPGAVPVLMSLLQDPNVAPIAQEALGGFPDKEADAAVLTLIKATNPEQKLQGIDLAARRRLKEAVPAITAAVTDPDAKVRTAALRRLGEMGGAAELPGLLNALLKTTSAQELGALEQGLVAICNTIGQPDDAATILVPVLGKAQAAQKSALVRVLGAIGGGKALQAVKNTVSDTDPDVHTTAIRTLGEWKNAEAAEALLAVAKTAQKNSDKILSLRNYLKIAGSQETPVAQRLAMSRQAEPLLQRDEEKKMLLGVLGGVANAEAVTMIAPYLDNAGTKEEACAAIGAAADKMTGKGAKPQAVAALNEILKKALATTSNPALKQKLQPLVK